MDEKGYMEDRLENQINWYDGKSQENQRKYKAFRITEIVLSALIPVLVPFVDFFPWVGLILALGGASVVAIIGIQGLYNFHENWIQYRMVAEVLKHEKYLYLTNTGEYASAEEPYKLMVSRVESVISHENINWSQFNKGPNKND